MHYVDVSLYGADVSAHCADVHVHIVLMSAQTQCFSQQFVAIPLPEFHNTVAFVLHNEICRISIIVSLITFSLYATYIR